VLVPFTNCTINCTNCTKKQKTKTPITEKQTTKQQPSYNTPAVASTAYSTTRLALAAAFSLIKSQQAPIVTKKWELKKKRYDN